MIQNRRRMLDFLKDYLYIFIVLVIVQIIAYFYYPDFFDVYDQMLYWIYNIFYVLWDFAFFILDYIVSNFDNFLLSVGVLILVKLVYNVYRKIFIKTVSRLGNR